MNTTAPITQPAAPGRAAPRSDAGHNASPAASEHRTFGEMLAETIPLVDVIAGYGPPVIFLAGPWLLLGLMLSGPFAVLVILVVFMAVAAAAAVALAAAMLAVPYMLVRGLRAQRSRHAFRDGPAVQLIPVESPRVVA